ncbi:hypothetical protein BpHYR1_037311 [Brachionus plicatilis]|uniref:Uncharacterized protein n=1 Tax=Brachionus plicatilis TaxID=10195 RepID=A0A3M7RY60_BRAPC|nr:hypothetical protein BpHYR1_037311 [Brachionus plicatilis]
MFQLSKWPIFWAGAKIFFFGTYFNYDINLSNEGKLDLNKAEWDKFRELLLKKIPDEIKDNVEKYNRFIAESLIYAATNSIPTFKTRNIKKKLLSYN